MGSWSISSMDNWGKSGDKSAGKSLAKRMRTLDTYIPATLGIGRDLIGRNHSNKSRILR